MLSIRQKRAASGGIDSGSPLASQLQQAWLQAQISSQSSPKFLKRALSQDISAERRASTQEEFHQVASDLSSIVADHAGLSNARNRGDLYFHKSRHETPEFPKRLVLPQLVSYSRKADVPQRSTSSSGAYSRFSTSDSLSSESSSSSEIVALDDAGDAADSKNKNLDDVFMLPEDFDYQAMAKNFDELVGPDAWELEPAYDNSWTAAGFLPTEEGVTDKFIHAYTCNLTKHVGDVCGNVDSSTWTIEGDACTDHSDESWDWYLECIRAKSGGDRRSMDISSWHQDFSVGDELMSPESFSFTPGCVDLKGLLLRYRRPTYLELSA